MTHFRVGLNAGAGTNFSELTRRWRMAEELGFDSLWVPDHTASFATGGAGLSFDGWICLAAMASNTDTIRIGTMVTNPILRHPTILAKQALAVDHLSGGRLELGIGTGVAEFDYDAVGRPVMTPTERAAHLADYIDTVIAVMESPTGVNRRGTHYSTATVHSPEPVQRPRPPVTVGGQIRRVIQIAGRHADRWNTHGPAGASVDEIVELTRRQLAVLNEAAVAADRDPLRIVKSLMGVQALDVWTGETTLPAIVDRFQPMGFSELIIGWPGDDRIPELERVASEVIPDLRK